MHPNLELPSLTVIPAAQKTPEETKGEHALRYLNSILAWHTAVDYVVGPYWFPPVSSM